jgi:hypothetical protein
MHSFLYRQLQRKRQLLLSPLSLIQIVTVVATFIDTNTCVGRNVLRLISSHFIVCPPYPNPNCDHRLSFLMHRRPSQTH